MTIFSLSKGYQAEVIKRNFFLIILVLLICFLLLGFRLVELQLIKGESYQLLADSNRYFRQTIPAPRGVFLDRYQQPLVKNTKIYFQDEDDGLYPKQIQIDHETALNEMAENSWKISYQLRRQYRYPWQLAHVLGYLSPVTAQDLINNRQLSADDWVGKIGLENNYDQVLRGKDGYKMYEVDTFGKKKRLINELEPVAGQDIQTSLDPYLSKIAFEALDQMTGAMVILDAQTGQVLALVSKPTFNSNDFSNIFLDESQEIQRKSNIASYFADERQVFFNRAVGGTYPPGSIFKIVTAVAGLEAKAFDEHKTVFDEGILKVGDYEYANWLFTARGATDGEIALVRAIARSNDIYFYKAAEWVGPNALANQARVFGFGEKTGIELPGEAAGLVPDPAWKEQKMGERWFLGNTYHFGIGQGDMMATPLQVAQFIQSMSKNRELCQPRLVINDGKYQWSADNCKNLGLQENSVELSFRGMIAVCQPGGTGVLLFKYNQGFSPADEVKDALKMMEQGAVACKTGTSEFGGQDERGRRKTHGWFVATTAIDQNKLESNLENILNHNLDTNTDDILDQNEIELWLEGIGKHGFPKKLVFVALVESDEAIPFKEGSREAATVVEKVLSYVK